MFTTKHFIKGVFLMPLFSFAFNSIFAQAKLPTLALKDVEGKEVSTSSLIDSNKLTVINFWATWCKPCLQELDAISDDYQNWLSNCNCKVVAISIDDSRTFAGVKNVVAGRGWPFLTYIDMSQQLKRSLNITNVPYTIVIDSKGNIIKKHSGYTTGSEAELLDFLKEYKRKRD
jgi:cytochrome c biogenesis protein CcmG, thiol:disulfide interchange protein DsbE